jgi:hypothetical protein
VLGCFVNRDGRMAGSKIPASCILKDRAKSMGRAIFVLLRFLGSG